MHSRIYLIYSLFIFLIGLGFIIVGEFNRPPKPELKDPNLIGHEDEENEEGAEPEMSEISGEDIQMPVPEPEEPTIEDIALDTGVEGGVGENGEEGAEENADDKSSEEDEDAEPPIYDGHEEERIELIKENYIAQEAYDSSRWTTYIGFAFWALAIVCAILYFNS
ncbi:hypothetical protein [Butyrivibrio sp. VCD2006]|uniref:hypothetical protein n=1 Tax=Butyrivibrio sp. VCD2006 TaxID=1280664 RepID=UPI00042737D8|nr:hypothetical protein [Butyrivibrio sp. VCD2006]